MTMWQHALLATGGFVGAVASAQPRGAAVERVNDSLQVRADWDETRLQPFGAPLSITLSRLLRVGDGRLAVIVGSSDVSDVVQQSGRRLHITPLAVRRDPPRDGEVDVFLVDSVGRWRSLGRFALRRQTRGGFDSAAFAPRMDLQTDGQLGAGRSAASPIPSRADTYNDVTGAAGVDGRLSRGGWQVSWDGLVNGASLATARLRAAQLGQGAPALDLASYGVRASKNGIMVSAGHVALGTHRLLASQFRSRGITAALPLGRNATLALGTAAGSEIVGWGDPLGLSRPTHRVATATLGMEAIAARPGLLRVDISALDGRLQSLPAFAQGAVTDREASSGLGAQVTAAHPSQRVRLTFGVARSRFRNPFDPALSGDSTLVEVRSETRDARFGELVLDAVRGATIAGLSTSMSVTLRHERADPLYRSVGAIVQADREQDALEATGQFGAIQWQATASRARDNLANIAALLITRTQAYAFSAAFPVAQLIKAPATAWWWPSLSTSWQLGAQRGDTTPPDGGFRGDFQIPDQRTQAMTTRAVWQRGSLMAMYRHDRSLVDNRQPERERADLRAVVHAITLSATNGVAFTGTLDVSSELQRSTETGARATNQRISAQADWRPLRHTAIAAAASFVQTVDPSATQRGQNLEFRAEVSQGVNAWRRPTDGSQARAFLRFARTGAALRLAGLPQPLANQWSLNGGLSVRLF